MNASTNIPWQRIYDFVLYCGNFHDQKSFSIAILSGIEAICTFDQSLIYYLDGNGKVCNQYLKNIDKQWSTMYLEYYSKTNQGSFDLGRDFREDPSNPTVRLKFWDKEPANEFIRNYIRPRGLKYSLGFALFDINAKPRTIFALDRTSTESFSENEILSVKLAVPLLNNLHKNFFANQTSRQVVEQIPWETTKLTTREIEIANLLCQGVSTASISEILYISPSTTYKHIANIYKKMNVSTKQELLVRMLG